MAKRTSRRARPTSGKSAKSRPWKRPPGIVQTSLYLPEIFHEALRTAAYEEHRKIHDIVLEGIEMALRKRGWKP